ncbi:MAG: hypothetical protein QG619_160 [Pseudomonadota bacterium]|nr:hypothetical protein [Pseudomonadota bacterium]
MPCIENRLDSCDLESDEVAAIAEHEQVSIVVAAELGCKLLQSQDGVARLHVMMLDDIQLALNRGRINHANELADTYRNFRGTHPLPMLSR